MYFTSLLSTKSMTKLSKHSKSPLAFGKDDPKFNYHNIYPVAPFMVYEDGTSRKSLHHVSAAKVVDPKSDDSGNKLCNRMIMCIFAICILWLTSLQICVAIVSTNIKIPSFSSVITNCKYAYGVVKEQSNYYSDCTSRQVAMCQENLDASYVNEKFRVHENQLANTQYLSAYQQSVGNCSSSVSAAKGAVSTWTGLGVTYTIPYYANCTGTSSVG